MKQNRSEFANIRVRGRHSLLIGGMISIVMLSLIVHLHSASRSMEHERYNYDSSGNLVEMRSEGAATELSYDSNRLVSSKDEANQLSRYDYSESGSLKGVQGVGGPLHEMSYGFDDRVLSSNSENGFTEFFYNAERRLVATTTSEIDPELYFWDTHALLAQGNECYVNEVHLMGGVPTIVSSPASKDNVIISDYLGTTLAIGDSEVVKTLYGQGSDEGRLTTRPYVKGLGGYLFPRRVYSNEILRWQSLDPVGYPDGKNQYEYVKNNPTRSIDPQGTITFDFEDPNPEDVIVPNGATAEPSDNVMIQAYDMEVRDRRSVAKDLIDTMNEGLSSSMQWAVTVSTYALGGDVEYVIYRAKNWAGGHTSGGAEIDCYYTDLGPLTGDVEEYERHMVQTVYTNLPIYGSPYVSYLDNGGSDASPFYPYGYPFGATPNFYDFSRRPFSKLEEVGDRYAARDFSENRRSPSRAVDGEARSAPCGRSDALRSC